MQRTKKGTDQAWPDAVRFGLASGAHGIGDVLWRCDGRRGGRVYSSGLFRTREEAEAFAQKLQNVEPDHTFSVEAIQASAVWN